MGWLIVRLRIGLGLVLLGPAASAPAQRFGFVHQSLPAHAEPCYALALGDVDGDGDLDVFVGNKSLSGYAEPNRLYLNDGTGVFADVTATNLPSATSLTEDVALGDVDGDGDLDAFVGNGGVPFGAQNRLYLNAGAGVFSDATASNLPTLLDNTMAVALGDVDGDGDLDAFVGNSFQQSRLHLNGGAGVFADATATNLPVLLSDQTTSVAFGDVDGDGDLDAFVGTFWGPNRLYSNGGTGVFAATNLPLTTGPTQDIEVGDLDGDGDLDAFVGGSGLMPGAQNGLYLNGGAGVFSGAPATNLPALLEARASSPAPRRPTSRLCSRSPRPSPSATWRGTGTSTPTWEPGGAPAAARTGSTSTAARPSSRTPPRRAFPPSSTSRGRSRSATSTGMGTSTRSRGTGTSRIAST